MGGGGFLCSFIYLFRRETDLFNDFLYFLLFFFEKKGRYLVHEHRLQARSCSVEIDADFQPAKIKNLFVKKITFDSFRFEEKEKKKRIN